MNQVTRQDILDAVISDLGNEPYILAIWLEGSDGTKNLDAYSDIDLVCYAKDGSSENMISKFDECMARLGDLDIVYEEPGRPEFNRYKVYHIKGTHEHLLIDVTFQTQSFPVSFLREDKTVIPVVLLDKAGIVKFRDLDSESFRAELRSQLMNAQGVYAQRSRAVKYTQRALFLESLIYYQKFVLNPFVDVLRIVYTPFQADCFLVHATRDFPTDVVTLLEDLYGVKSVEDIAKRIQLVDGLFAAAVAQAESRFSKTPSSW